MATTKHDAPAAVDSRSGFCVETKIFHSLRRRSALPPSSLPISVASHALSLLPSPLPSNLAVVDAATGESLSYPDFLSQIRSLAAALRSEVGISAGDVAFVLSPSRIEIPVLNLALLSIGAVVSAGNPISTPAEISHQFALSKPSIAFAALSVVNKIPTGVPVLAIDSPAFRSMLSGSESGAGSEPRQSDPAAILYSSGTTGAVKGVVLSHRNIIAITAGYKSMREEFGDAAAMEEGGPGVMLFTVPLFHVFGFFMSVRCVALGETMVLMERFEFEAMLRAVERHRVTSMPVSPPLVVAMAKSELVRRHDLSSLRAIGCGGAPLGSEVAELFASRFPGVDVNQGYGLTESGGSATTTATPEECKVYGTAGRLAPDMEAKVVDPGSGEAMGPGKRGELWLRGPTIMKGYVGNKEATASTLHSEGWLMTGDLGYFDQDGFLFIVDRLKDLIKYKAYQVPPAELEHILQSHPEVADVAVVPYPDEEAGQIPMAVVVRKPESSLDEGQVMDFVAKQVAPYKKVRRVVFVGSIPRNPAGKILKRELTNQLAPGTNTPITSKL